MVLLTVLALLQADPSISTSSQSSSPLAVRELPVSEGVRMAGHQATAQGGEGHGSGLIAGAADYTGQVSVRKWPLRAFQQWTMVSLCRTQGRSTGASCLARERRRREGVRVKNRKKKGS